MLFHSVLILAGLTHAFSGDDLAMYFQPISQPRYRAMLAISLKASSTFDSHLGVHFHTFCKCTDTLRDSLNFFFD